MEDNIIELIKKYDISKNILKNWIELNNIEITDFDKIDTLIKDNLEMIKSKPLVKWVGGKRQLLKQFQDLYPTNYNNYFEPFLGGGAVFFNTQNKNSYLSDMNTELVNLYNVVKNQSNELISFLETLKYNKELFLEIRAWDKDPEYSAKYTNVQKAGRFIYLNRTCFNGLYRVNSKGYFNSPFGKYDNPDFVQRENINNVNKLLNKLNVQINNHSFEEILELVNPGDFVYLDPPYDELSNSSNFTSYDKTGFGIDMQKKLANFCNLLNEKGVYFMLSNHNTPLINELYNDYDKTIVKAKRNINSKGDKRGIIDEIVVRNY